MGFDQDRSLGEGEQGGRTCRTHLDLLHARGAGGRAPARGAGARRHRHARASRPKTGLLASSDDPNGIMEKFIEGNLPKAGSLRRAQITRTR